MYRADAGDLRGHGVAECPLAPLPPPFGGDSQMLLQALPKDDGKMATKKQANKKQVMKQAACPQLALSGLTLPRWNLRLHSSRGEATHPGGVTPIRF